MTRAFRVSALPLTALLLVIGGALTPAMAAPPTQADDGGIGIRLLEAPVDRRDDPRAQVAVVDHVPPGTLIERAFQVSNTTDETQTVRVYVGPAEIARGQFALGDPGDANELTGWSTTSARRVTLAPGEERPIELTIKVPADASEGERYGVIWASVAADGGQVDTINRVGIRIYLSIGPGGEPSSDFEIESIQPGRTQEGAPYVTATVVNTGGRALDPRGQLSLRDGPGGLKAGPYDVGPITLAPGDERAVTVQLDPSLPAGPWTARLVLRSGLLERTATATITFPEQGEGEAVAADDDTPWWQSWLIWVGLGLALLLLLALLLWLLRRRRRPEDETEDAPPTGGSMTVTTRLGSAR